MLLESKPIVLKATMIFTAFELAVIVDDVVASIVATLNASMSTLPPCAFNTLFCEYPVALDNRLLVAIMPPAPVVAVTVLESSAVKLVRSRAVIAIDPADTTVADLINAVAPPAASLRVIIAYFESDVVLDPMPNPVVKIPARDLGMMLLALTNFQ